MRYQKEIERLEKDNRELRKQLILREQKTGKRRVMKVLLIKHLQSRFFFFIFLD